MEIQPKRRPRVRNTSDATKGTVCHGCDWFEVLTSSKWSPEITQFVEAERYCCCKSGATVEPRAMTRERCDEIREVRRYTR